jgi:hypothetical protein
LRARPLSSAPRVVWQATSTVPEGSADNKAAIRAVSAP